MTTGSATEAARGSSSNTVRHKLCYQGSSVPPPPRRGRTRVGVKAGGAHARLPPHPNLPPPGGKEKNAAAAYRVPNSSGSSPRWRQLCRAILRYGGVAFFLDYC